MESQITKKQVKTDIKTYTEGGETYRLKVELRFDDECGNGHNTFAITGTQSIKDRYGRYEEFAGGCLHDEIEKHFPQYAKYIKYHLCSTEGPMHYYANTMYLAGNKDCYGHVKGEPDRFEYLLKFGDFPITFMYQKSFIDWIIEQSPETLEIDSIHHPREPETFGPKYTFYGFACKWHGAPFDTIREAEEFLEATIRERPNKVKLATSFSQGKEPEIDSARKTAIWPDATPEQLTDRKALEEHLKGLMVEFKGAMEELGFKW